MQMCRVRHLKLGYLQAGGREFGHVSNAGLWTHAMAEKIAARIRSESVYNGSVHAEPLPWDHNFPMAMPKTSKFAVWVIYAARRKGLDVTGHPVMILPYKEHDRAIAIAKQVRIDNDADTWVTREQLTRHQMQQLVG